MKTKKLILPKDNSETKSEKNNLFNDDLFASIKIGNQFQHAIEKAILSHSKEDFNEAYNKHKAHLEADKPDKTKRDERDINMTLIEYISCAVIEALYKKEFQDNCGLEYYNVVSDAMAPRVLSFIFWAAGKKETATQILEKHSSNITDKQYDDFYEILKLELRLHKQPFYLEEKEELYNTRKEEFLFAQNKLKLVKELSDGLPQIPMENVKKQKSKL